MVADGVRKSGALDLQNAISKSEQVSANEEGLCARGFVGVFFRVAVEVFIYFIFSGERGEPAGRGGALSTCVGGAEASLVCWLFSLQVIKAHSTHV